MLKKLSFLLLVLANLAVIGYFWYSGSGAMLGSGQISTMIALGRLAGLLSVFFVLMEFILIGRILWIEKVLGLDTLSRIHHYNGMFVGILILLHPYLIISSYAQASEVGFLAQIKYFLFNYEDLTKALIAFILFVGIIVWSIIAIRRKINYEIWKISHAGMYLAVLFAFGHQMELGGDFLANPSFRLYWVGLYFVVIGSFTVFRFLIPLIKFYNHRFQVEKVVKENDSVTSVYITGRNIQDFSIKPGQFGIFRFMSVGRWWQAHPFSFSKPHGADSLRITVKNVGDFTSKLSDIKPGTFVVVEGPFGVFTDSERVKKKVLLIAGGIGVTPIRALSEQMTHNSKDVEVIYNARTGADFVLANEMKAFVPKLKLVASGDPSWSGEQGMIDKEKLTKLVPDASEREVFVCGPWPMMKSVISIATSIGIPKNRIHYEKFSLA